MENNINNDSSKSKAVIKNSISLSIWRNPVILGCVCDHADSQTLAKMLRVDQWTFGIAVKRVWKELSLKEALNKDMRRTRKAGTIDGLLDKVENVNRYMAYTSAVRTVTWLDPHLYVSSVCQLLDRFRQLRRIFLPKMLFSLIEWRTTTDGESVITKCEVVIRFEAAGYAEIHEAAQIRSWIANRLPASWHIELVIPTTDFANLNKVASKMALISDQFFSFQLPTVQVLSGSATEVEAMQQGIALYGDRIDEIDIAWLQNPAWLSDPGWLRGPTLATDLTWPRLDMVLQTVMSTRHSRTKVYCELELDMVNLLSFIQFGIDSPTGQYIRQGEIVLIHLNIHAGDVELFSAHLGRGLRAIRPVVEAELSAFMADSRLRHVKLEIEYEGSPSLQITCIEAVAPALGVLAGTLLQVDAPVSASFNAKPPNNPSVKKDRDECFVRVLTDTLSKMYGTDIVTCARRDYGAFNG